MSLLLLSAILTMAATAAVAGPTPPPIPPEWQQVVYADRMRNTGGWLPQGELNPVRVFHWDVPQDLARLYLSQFFAHTPEDALVRFTKDGQSFVRIFVREEEQPGATRLPTDMEELSIRMKEAFGEPHQNYWAVKLTSHNTYFMWNPDDPKETPYYLKAEIRERYQGSDKLHSRNGEEQVKLAVAMSDRVEKIQRDHPERPDSALPERIGVAVDLPDSKNKTLRDTKARTYSYNIRSVTPMGKTPDPNVVEFPLHGLLGHSLADWGKFNSYDQIDQLAPFLKVWKGGNGAEEWIFKEYIPKLARFLATKHYLEGIFPGAHTQNLLVRINRETGEIEGFDFRDMSGTFVDPLALISQGETQLTDNLPENASRINWTDNVTPLKGAKYAGGNFYGFVSQVLDIFPNTKRDVKGKAMDALLGHYIEESARATGVDVKISPKTQAAREKMVKNPDRSGFLKDPNADAIIDSVQETYDQISKDRGTKLGARAESGNQKELARIFDRSIDDQRVAWFLPESRGRYSGLKSIVSSLDYRYDGSGVLVVDRRSGNPVGYAYDLLDGERVRIQETQGEPGSLGLTDCLRRYGFPGL